MLVKAVLTHLASLESFPVLWNPRGYALARTNRLVASAVPGAGPGAAQFAAGGEQRFVTRLFLDSTGSSGPERDLRAAVERLERWAEPEAETGLPSRVVFHWGSFRFRGVIEDLREEWVLFDPDGTPIRAWVDLVLRK